MTRSIDAELLTYKISCTGFPHIDRNGRIDKSWVYELINSCPTVESQMTELEEHFYHRCGFLQGMEYGKELSGADMREADNDNSR